MTTTTMSGNLHPLSRRALRQELERFINRQFIPILLAFPLSFGLLSPADAWLRWHGLAPWVWLILTPVWLLVILTACMLLARWARAARQLRCPHCGVLLQGPRGTASFVLQNGLCHNCFARLFPPRQPPVPLEHKVRRRLGVYVAGGAVVAAALIIVQAWRGVFPPDAVWVTLVALVALLALAARFAWHQVSADHLLLIAPEYPVPPSLRLVALRPSGNGHDCFKLYSTPAALCLAWLGPYAMVRNALLFLDGEHASLPAQRRRARECLRRERHYDAADFAADTWLDEDPRNERVARAQLCGVTFHPERRPRDIRWVGALILAFVDGSQRRYGIASPVAPAEAEGILHADPGMAAAQDAHPE